MDLTSDLKRIWCETAEVLSGYDRRHFMAMIVRMLGAGGCVQAERELGWNRGTIRKALEELDGQFCYIDQFAARGRKPAEEHLPDLLSDMKAIVEAYSQADPTFRTTWMYTRLSVAQVRQQLIEQKNYLDTELPDNETLRCKLNEMGFRLQAVKKTQPLKKIAETDAIFERMRQVNRDADDDPTVLRLSLDAKAPVAIGRFSLKGTSRIVVKAWDHDFNSKQKVTPFGIFLPQFDELFLYLTTSKVTSDFIVDCLTDFWHTQGHRFPNVCSLLLNLDNGPENHSRRTQFMMRLTQFADASHLTLQLAYYPPYHSKYNPIERVWAVLQHHWNGSLLDSLETVLMFARSMTWNGKPPQVELVDRLYHSGRRLTKQVMQTLEQRLERLQGLTKWFVQIRPFGSFLTLRLG